MGLRSSPRAAALSPTPANRELMLRSGVVVCLEARTDTILERLAADRAEVRPLLHGPSPRDRIEAMKEARQPAYALAHWTVHTDGLRVEEAAREVVRAWDMLRPRAADDDPSDNALAAVVHSSAGACPIYVGWGLLDELGQWCRRAGLSTTAYLVSDETVFRHYGRRAQAALEAAGHPHPHADPPGRRDLQDPGDGRCLLRMAGRAARGGGATSSSLLEAESSATWRASSLPHSIEECPLCRCPRPWLPWWDASIGGKNGRSTCPRGRTWWGRFHQPRLTLGRPADPHYPVAARDGGGVGGGHQARPHPGCGAPADLRGACRSGPGLGGAPGHRHHSPQYGHQSQRRLAGRAGRPWACERSSTTATRWATPSRRRRGMLSSSMARRFAVGMDRRRPHQSRHGADRAGRRGPPGTASWSVFGLPHPVPRRRPGDRATGNGRGQEGRRRYSSLGAP